MKTNSFLLLSAFISISGQLLAQATTRKLPPNINHPSVNVSAPFVCLDGNGLLFLSDYAEDNKIVMYYSSKGDGVNWKDPVMLPRVINNGLNFLKGFTLSPDGKTMYLTNLKGGGLGGYDIYKVDQKGSSWGDPVNLGLPFNSKLNDGSPTFAADGSAAYFMRCDKITFDKAEGCKIFMTKKKANGQWDEPVELPAFINTGNSQTPRILGDGETLIFSSNKFPQNKGGMDLYMTRWNGTAWSNPMPLNFVNTAGDDQCVSAASTGRYLLKDAPGAHKSELVEFLFPNELRPKATMKVEGTVNISSAYISVYDQKNQIRVFNGRPGSDGRFILYLNEGGIYDLSIEPEQDNFNFFSKEFNLVKDKIPTLEKVSASIKQVAAGDEIELAGVSFKENSFELTSVSTQELRRAVRLMKGNPAFKFIVDVTLFGYKQDSVESDKDLTETTNDTLKIQISKKIADSTSTNTVKIIMADSLIIKRRFHNDRTPHQALEVANYLKSQGVAAKNISINHHAVAALPENKKILVKIIVK